MAVLGQCYRSYTSALIGQPWISPIKLEKRTCAGRVAYFQAMLCASPARRTVDRQQHSDRTNPRPAVSVQSRRVRTARRRVLHRRPALQRSGLCVQRRRALLRSQEQRVSDKVKSLLRSTRCEVAPVVQYRCTEGARRIVSPLALHSAALAGLSLRNRAHLHRRGRHQRPAVGRGTRVAGLVNTSRGAYAAGPRAADTQTQIARRRGALA